MISGMHRFHGHGSLRYVHKNGSSYRSSWFVVKVVANPRRRHSRMAVVVSKKVHKSAVGRNRIRRRVYEIMRHELPQVNSNYDIVVLVVSAEVRTAPARELQETIRELYNRAGLYKITPTPATIES